MSRWDPHEGDHDSVSFGSAKPPPSWPSASARRWLPAAIVSVLALLVGLAVGFGVGRESPRAAGAADGPPSAAAEIMANPISVTAEQGEQGPMFSLELLNTSDQSVTVTDFHFADLRSDLAEVQQGSLPPGIRKSLRFSAPPDCFQGVPQRLSSVHLELNSTRGSSSADVLLPDEGRALLQYLHAMCDATPVTRPEQLAGVWILEEPYALFPEGKGIHLTRFSPDGTFAADPEGVLLLDEPRGVEGTYRLRGDRLVLDVTGGYGCGKGAGVVWSPGLLREWNGVESDDTPRLTLAWVSGDCPTDGRGEVWVLRKILLGVHDRAGN